MDVTIIGTGNMARGIGAGSWRAATTVTVLGKDTDNAEAVVSDLGADGSAKPGHSGDAIVDDIVVLAVF